MSSVCIEICRVNPFLFILEHGFTFKLLLSKGTKLATFEKSVSSSKTVVKQKIVSSRRNPLICRVCVRARPCGGRIKQQAGAPVKFLARLHRWVVTVTLKHNGCHGCY